MTIKIAKLKNKKVKIKYSLLNIIKRLIIEINRSLFKKNIEYNLIELNE